MPAYHIHLAVEAHEPFPPVDTLPEVEALDPISAVEEFIAQGQFSQSNPPQWARVVLNAHPNGVPNQVLRVPLEIDRTILLDSRKRGGERIV
jgi:hypothetical protein